MKDVDCFLENVVLYICIGVMSGSAAAIIGMLIGVLIR